MKTKENFVKINIPLPRNAYYEFNKISIKEGICKSSLLRGWIDKIPENFSIDNCNFDNQKISYSFYLNFSQYKKLKNLAKFKGISFANALRFIILFNINKKIYSFKPLQVAANKNEYLWQKGFYAEFINNLGDDLEKYSFSDLVKCGEASLHIGDFTRLNSIIDVLNKASFSNEHQALIGFFEGIINLNQKRDLQGAKDRFITALSALNTNNRTLAAKLYLSLGMISYYQDNYDHAENMFNRALEYIDIIDHPLLYSEAYNRKSLNYIAKGMFNEAQQCSNRSKSILESNYNAFYLSTYYRRASILNYSSNNLNLAELNLKNCIKYNNISGSKIGLAVSYEEMAKIYIAKRDIDKAYMYILESRKIEQRERPEVMFSRSRLFESFIEAKDNFKDSEYKISLEMNRSTVKVQNFLSQYVQNATKYLFGENEEVIKEGFMKLKQLSVECTSSAIKIATTETLNNKILKPVW